MIESIEIRNLVLVDRAAIAFGPGLNILTGETGAGKSAVIAAIRLILGGRADSQLIKGDADLAVVEAKVGSCCIRREIHRSGKSRCFIDDELATLQELKEKIGRSVEIVDQSAAAFLQQEDEQRYLLDSFGSLFPDAEQFSHLHRERLSAESELSRLLEAQSEGAKELQSMQEEWSAIEEVNWQPGEEEKLEAEHTLLTHSQELLEKSSAVLSFLTEGPSPAAPSVKRFANMLEQLAALDPNLRESADLLKTCALEMQEAGRQLASYANRIDIDPSRLAALEERIGAIEALKRRFGKNQADLQHLQIKLKNRIDQIENLDQRLEDARTSAAKLRAEELLSASKLTQKRERAAILLASKVMAELKHLNLPDARFAIALEKKPVSSSGEDKIAFLFAANPGQPLLPLTECASGGELSRLLFAIKTALAEKLEAKTLIFDEIDSNVGGQTAAMLGAKLQSLSSSLQLLCITHFVQVARCAQSHFLVSKHLEHGTAATNIRALSNAEREKEYARMVGGA